MIQENFTGRERVVTVSSSIVTLVLYEDPRKLHGARTSGYGFYYYSYSSNVWRYEKTSRGAIEWFLSDNVASGVFRPQNLQLYVRKTSFSKQSWFEREKFLRYIFCEFFLWEHIISFQVKRSLVWIHDTKISENFFVKKVHLNSYSIIFRSSINC